MPSSMFVRVIELIRSTIGSDWTDFVIRIPDLDKLHIEAEYYLLGLYTVVRLTICSTFTNPEHLGTAYRTYTLGCWFAVFHSNTLRILHFPFCSALHTIRLHSAILLFIMIFPKYTICNIMSIGLVLFYIDILLSLLPLEATATPKKIDFQNTTIL